MISAGLAATQVAFRAWTAATDFGRLDDEELGDAYRALSALLRDVEDAHAKARHLMVRRIMATKAHP